MVQMNGSSIADDLTQDLNPPENGQETTQPPDSQSQIQGRKSDRDLLELLLKDKDADFKARVMEIVHQLGVYPSDPLFYVLISTGTLQALLETSPKQLEYMFGEWGDRLFERFQKADSELEERIKSYGAGAIKVYQKDVAKGVNEILNKTSVQQAQRSLPTLIWAGSICAALVGLGVVVGWMGGSSQTMKDLKVGGLDPSGERRLTIAELDALTWATSKEGTYARNLLDWNREQLINNGSQCQQQAKNLGLVLRFGNKETGSGFCPLWVVAPQDRKFNEFK